MTIDATKPASAALISNSYRAHEKSPETGKNGAHPPRARQVADRVEISDAARGAAGLRESLSSLMSSFGKYQAKFAAFGDELGNKFRAAGVDTGTPVDLRVDDEGRIRVPHAHPDKDGIEKIFAGDSDFANRFRGISAASSLLKAAEDHVAFAAAYRHDPEAAIARYPDLFSSRNPADAMFRFAGTNLTASFADQTGAQAPWASSHGDTVRKN